MKTGRADATPACEQSQAHRISDWRRRGVNGPLRTRHPRLRHGRRARAGPMAARPRLPLHRQSPCWTLWRRSPRVAAFVRAVAETRRWLLLTGRCSIHRTTSTYSSGSRSRFRLGRQSSRIAAAPCALRHRADGRGSCSRPVHPARRMLLLRTSLAGETSSQGRAGPNQQMSPLKARGTASTVSVDWPSSKTRRSSLAAPTATSVTVRLLSSRS